MLLFFLSLLLGQVLASQFAQAPALIKVVNQCTTACAKVLAKLMAAVVAKSMLTLVVLILKDKKLSYQVNA